MIMLDPNSLGKVDTVATTVRAAEKKAEHDVRALMCASAGLFCEA